METLFALVAPVGLKWSVVLLRGHVCLVVCIFAVCMAALDVASSYQQLNMTELFWLYLFFFCDVSDAGCRLCVVFKYNKRCDVE